MFLRLIVVCVFAVSHSLLRCLSLSAFARLLWRQFVYLCAIGLAGWSSACAILKDAPKTGSKVGTFVMVQACQNVLATPTPTPPLPIALSTICKIVLCHMTYSLTYRTIKKIYVPNEVVRKCVCMQQINSKSNLFLSFLGNLFWFLFK